MNTEPKKRAKQIHTLNEPPKAIDIERALLAAMFIDPECIAQVIAKIEPVHFYLAAHQRIFEAIRMLWRSGGAVDPLTVTDKLRTIDMLGDGGGDYILELLTAAVSSGNIGYHMAVLQEKAAQRKLLDAGIRLQGAVGAGNVTAEELLGAINADIAEVEIGLTSKQDFISADDGGNALLDRLKFYEDNKGKHIGLRIGYPEIEKYIRGLEPSEYIIIAARPSMGKSSFMVNILCNLAFGGYRSGVFVLESTAIKLWERIGCRMTMVSQDDLILDTFQDGKKNKFLENISRIKGLNNIWMCDSGDMTLSRLRARCQYAKERYKLDVIFIDHIGCIRHRGDSINAAMSEVSQEIKGMAKALKIPIVAIHQLSRNVEHREQKRPMLSDLRDSGTLEQDADKVLFVFRPNYYKLPDDKEYNPDGSEKVEILISKNRDGQAGKTVSMKFYDKFGLFASKPK